MPSHLPNIRDVELRFGYSLAQIDDIAITAAATSLRPGHLDRQTRFEYAWSAVTDLLFAAEVAPTRQDLFLAAWSAIRDEARKDRSFRGERPGFAAGSMPAFERFWATATNPTPNPENRIVERIALTQIWPELRLRFRQVLLALAAWEDYKRAAAALDMPYSTFCSEVSRARRAFRALWHQGETPSRPWGRDVRTRSSRTRGHSLRDVLVKRENARKRRNSEDVTPRRRDLDKEISNEDMARRFKNGETLRSIAESLGIGISTVHRRIAPYR